MQMTHLGIFSWPVSLLHSDLIRLIIWIKLINHYSTKLLIRQTSNLSSFTVNIHILWLHCHSLNSQ